MTIIISSFIKNTRPNICNIFERGVFQRLQRWQNWQTCNYCQLFFWGMHCLLGLVCLYIISQDRQDCDKKKSRDCLHSDHDGCSPVQIFCQQTVAAPAWMGQKSEDWQTTVMVGFMWVLIKPFYAYLIFVTNITNVEKFQFLNVTEICFVTIRALLCGEKLQIMRYDFMRHCTVERVSIVCL